MYIQNLKLLFHIAWLVLLLTGCQSKVYLMPPPVSLGSDNEFFELSEEDKDENLLYTLYASNRLPYKKQNSSRGYTIFPTDNLELGRVMHRVGDPGMSWDDLYRQSSVDTRDEDLILHQVHARKKVRYDKEDELKNVPPTAGSFFENINRQIDLSFDKDITIYVHGANSNFYRATAQGAQFYHFTGHNSIVLTFAWPSAANMLKYQTDVLHASQTILAFARLVELLAIHTKARNINILAYSAGAQIAVPGLAYLRELYADLPGPALKQRMRIGEVYLAAPDSDFPSFTEHYIAFKEIVGRTTINLNSYDSVLRYSAMQHAFSRLGKPDLTEITEEQRDFLVAASKTPEFDILDVGNSEALELGGAHDSWYQHPWVSNDMILLLLFNVLPEDRGLVSFIGEKGARTWRFPPDYDERIRSLIKQNKEKGKQEKQAQKAHGD